MNREYLVARESLPLPYIRVRILLHFVLYGLRRRHLALMSADRTRDPWFWDEGNFEYATRICDVDLFVGLEHIITLSKFQQ